MALRQRASRGQYAFLAQTLDDALTVAVALEQADLEDLYDDLILQGEPAFKLISERLEAALATPSAGSPAAFSGRTVLFRSAMLAGGPIKVWNRSALWRPCWEESSNGPICWAVIFSWHLISR